MSDEKPKRKFRWWYKGKTPEGNTCSFEGTGFAVDAEAAGQNIEKMMRGQWPSLRWMHGKDVEGEGDNVGVKFGPTVQMKALPKPRNAR